jgi:glutathione S-transferase
MGARRRKTCFILGFRFWVFPTPRPRGRRTISLRPYTHTIIAAYWAIRGLAQPIRVLLKHVGIPFEDKLYHEGAGEAEWFEKDKGSLGLPYPNLPYFIEPSTGLKLTQSLAIMRYVGAKGNLLGGAPGTAGAAAVDVAIYQIVDFRRVVGNSVYTNSPTVEAFRDTEVPKWLGIFEAAIKAHGGAWTAGNDLSIADFALCEALEQVRIYLAEKGGVADALAPFPTLSALLDRFIALPTVAAYRASPEFMARPWNGTEAQFR